MQKILLIEDELDMQLMVKLLLSDRYQLIIVPTAGMVAKALEHNSVDLVLLDVSLPDGDGFRIFSELRSSPKLKDVPIVFLTGKSGVNDRVAAFSLGAEDYIVKPFEPLEFRARVESKMSARLNRKQVRDVLVLGRLELDRAMFKAFALDEPGLPRNLGLTSHEFRLLAFFVEHEGHVLSRDRLMNAIWGADVHVLERTIDRHVSALRRKLGGRFEKIESVQGIGYRFCALSPALAPSVLSQAI